MDDAWNTNPLRYIIRDYCKRYPDDRGDDKIRDEDVIRPYNYKYTTGTDEQTEWRKKRDVAIPTYGTCATCYSSGPAFKRCKFCGLDKYKTLVRGKAILDSQTIGKRFNKPHETAQASEKQHWVRTDSVSLGYDRLKILAEYNLQDITDDDARDEAVKNEINDFFKDYNW